MQKGGATVQHGSVSKLTLLAIITVSMIAILWILVIMPHILSDRVREGLLFMTAKSNDHGWKR